MAECILLKGGGDGVDLDVITVEPSDVLAGEVFIDKEGEPKTGTLAVQSILSFSAAVYSSTAIAFTWKNPAKGPFSGVIVVGKTGSYPTSITDGTRYHKGSGNNTNANGTSSITISSFSSGITYYFRAFSYAVKDGAEWIHATTYTATAATTKGQQVITSSGTFTVPAGVRSIDVFCVGGGSGGNGGGRNSSSYSAGGGGGGGYTRTQKNISVTPGLNISIAIGAGGAGAAADSYGSGKPGGATTITINGTAYTANGGLGNSVTSGNHGGSGGGGAGGLGDGGGGVGGSNGSGGASGGSGGGGTGQGTTTRAFGESTNTLYAGGGGGGAQSDGAGAGGAGGGGKGANIMTGGSVGGVNTGGGGGGGYQYSPGGAGYAGGSGVCIIRWGY